MNKIKISTLYEIYKNTPKKLKIVCDWDEVIQAGEPYALWLANKNQPQPLHNRKVGFETFSEYFKFF